MSALQEPVFVRAFGKTFRLTGIFPAPWPCNCKPDKAHDAVNAFCEATPNSGVLGTFVLVAENDPSRATGPVIDIPYR